MITQFCFDGPLLKIRAPGGRESASAPPIWIDLLRPEAAEIAQIDGDFSTDLPTLEAMREIEVSSRLYEEGGGYYMTFTYVSDALGEHPETTPVTFVLKNDLLITVRYKDMRIVTHFIAKAESRGVPGPKSNAALLVLLLDGIVDLCADALEKGHSDIEAESKKVFDAEKHNKDYRQSLQQIAKIGELNSKMRESLVSLSRLHVFLGHALEKMKASEETAAKLRVLSADVQSLLDHAGFVSGKIAFLLDATLGLVNIEQNAIIKIFSVAAVIFLPPTLIASLYGMNFRHMPELEWLLGYPFALGLMVVSAILPYWYFKRRKWL